MGRLKSESSSFSAVGSSGLALIGAGLIVGTRWLRSNRGKASHRGEKNGGGDGAGAERGVEGNGLAEGSEREYGEGLSNHGGGPGMMPASVNGNGNGSGVSARSAVETDGKGAPPPQRESEYGPGRVPPATGPDFMGFNGNAPKARRFDEVIDLSPPAYFMDRFRIHNEANQERVMELRIGNREGDDFLFVRVNSHGKTSELSSGLFHCGVRTESSHGFTSGEGERGPLLLRCALKFDGRCFKLEMRLQTDCPQRKTLVYGSGVFEYPGLGPAAWVSIQEEELRSHVGGNG